MLFPRRRTAARSLRRTVSNKDFNAVVEALVKEEPRFDRQAYFFVREALDYTQRKKKSGKAGKPRHVTGRELLEGIREYALEQYGPMTMTLFENWGVRKGEDFGRIVFNLIECGIFGKTEQDCPGDFRNVYDFQEAFVRPFLPGPSARSSAGKSGGGKGEERREDT